MSKLSSILALLCVGMLVGEPVCVSELVVIPPGIQPELLALYLSPEAVCSLFGQSLLDVPACIMMEKNAGITSLTRCQQCKRAACALVDRSLTFPGCCEVIVLFAVLFKKQNMRKLMSCDCFVMQLMPHNASWWTTNFSVLYWG